MIKDAQGAREMTAGARALALQKRTDAIQEQVTGILGRIESAAQTSEGTIRVSTRGNTNWDCEYSCVLSGESTKWLVDHLASLGFTCDYVSDRIFKVSWLVP